MSQQPSGDWVVQVVDAIDRVVGVVRDKTTKPAVFVVRGLVYGLLAGILAIAILVLVTIAAVRALNLLPIGVWFSDMIVGALFVAIGGFLMVSRHASAAD